MSYLDLTVILSASNGIVFLCLSSGHKIDLILKTWRIFLLIYIYFVKLSFYWGIMWLHFVTFAYEIDGNKDKTDGADMEKMEHSSILESVV